MSSKELTKEISPDDLINMYKNMLLIREFEQRITKDIGKIKSSAIHAYIGEEAVAVGACAAINEDDYTTSTHRGHGHFIAKGGDINSLMAEIYGKVDGICKGRGGSMHVADFSKNMVGANGIVGAGPPLALGVALASKMRNEGKVVLSFFGDGAANQGMVHESMNLAAAWKLPVIFILENNLYGSSVPVRIATGIKDFSLRAQGYGMKGISIDGNDVIKVFKTVKDAVDFARKGGGPTLIECKTYRWQGHMVIDPDKIRPVEEKEEWKNRCPIKAFKTRLIQGEIIDNFMIQEIEKEILNNVELSVKFSKKSARPEVSTVLDDVYINPFKYGDQNLIGETKSMRVIDALRLAIDEEMEREESVFVLGEDVGVFGGAFNVTEGLYEKFGSERIRDTPISENAILGCAVGAAIVGMRPIAEIMFADFLTVCMEMIVNQAAKARYMYGGQISCPITIRLPFGAGMGLAAQHSQSFESWLMHVPGLKVVVPSHADDFKGLLKTAIRDDDPVIFFENKQCYFQSGEVPLDKNFTVPFGQARKFTEGDDVTIVATGAMVGESIKAAKKLEGENIHCEVIDPRTLVPMDKKTILNSVEKTGKLVIVDEGCKTCSVSAEIAAFVAEEGFQYLKKNIIRLNTPDVPIPYSQKLEKEIIPNSKSIQANVKKLI